jgi:hypothetical protein
MKRLLLVACASLAVLLLPVAASAQPAHADSPNVAVTVPQPIVVGNTMLQPGEYRFQCRTFLGKTFLVVTSAETRKEITRVPCVREMLNEKLSSSELHTQIDSGGKRTLTAVRLKGEMVSHRIVN